MTPQQHADHLLAEHQANRNRNMTLAEHDLKVKPHLDFIQAGAEMAARHARALPHKMAFTTHAQDELAEAREVLEGALQNIIAAQAMYENKPQENECAA
jgi:hypothetical protein